MPIWKRILKWLTWLLGGLLGLAVVAYLALLLINWRDVPPSESVRRLEAVHRNRPTASDADNGYVYVMGFSVAPNADPQEAGVRRVEWVRKVTPQSPFSAADDPAPGAITYQSIRPPVVKQLRDACQTGSGQCAQALERAGPALQEWIHSENWLLDRYLTLLHRPGWLETIPDVRAPLPAYALVLDGQELLLAQAYVLAEEKDAAAVQNLLRDDVKFWRHTLASSDILITKMIAVAALHRHFALGNLILRRLPAEVELQGMPQEWTAPMTDEERSLLRTFTGEWIFGDAIIRNAMPSGSWRAFEGFGTDDGVVDKISGRLFQPFFQPQDTSNRRAEMFIKATDAMNVPYEDLPAALARARAIFEAPGGKNGPFTRLYNPVGDLLLSASAAGFAPYGARVADVEGSRRAAVLTAQLRSRKVDVHDVAAELVASDLGSPYDHKPFLWDAGEQAIVFVGLQPDERGRHAFKY